MPKYCGKCGSKLDETTERCPKCDAEKVEDSSGKGKQKKGENRKQRSVGKKFFRFIGKTVLIALLLLILVIGSIGVLTYYKVVDMPEISYMIEKNGIQKMHNSVDNPPKDNYIPNEDSISYDEKLNQLYANNEIIVLFSQKATEIQKNAVIDFLNGKLAGTIPDLNMYQILIQECSSLEELISIADEVTEKFDYVIYATYDSATIDPEDAYAPNDPWAGDVEKDDWENETIDGSNWWIEATNVQYAWDYKDSFSNIVIGICDSSFDIGHEDLKSRVSFPNEILKSRNVVTPWWLDFNNWKDVRSRNVRVQENYHGTHVAGIIGAEGDNGKGIAGIVQNCRMLLAPFYRNENMDTYLAWDSSIYANLSYLVKAGARVINFSQGKTNFLQEKTNNIVYEKETIEREGNLAAASLSQLMVSGYEDFIVVQSAGNGTGDTAKAVDALQNGWFASITNNSISGYENISIQDVLSHVIIVGAAEQTASGFQTTSFSNYGDQVNVCAPGDKIFSTVPGELFAFQFRGGYAYAQGTSMSAPIVTGICALTWSANTNLSAGQVKNIVCNNASVVVEENPEIGNNTTYNMVDAKLSVEAALNYSGEIASDQFEQSVSPNGAVEFNGHWYKVIRDGAITDWNSAVQYCLDCNGYLATITSQEENDFLYSYITSAGYLSAYFGLSDAASEGHWEWSNGEKMSYTNWHRNEPNSEKSTENYAMFYYKYSDGTWNDGEFIDRMSDDGIAFICEWGEYELEPKIAAPAKTTFDGRDIVLVLDSSGSMSGKPMDETKKASVNFINNILNEDARIGIVTYDDNSYMLSDFSDNKSSLTDEVSNIYDGGGTNIEAGLAEAHTMLNASGAKKRIIVLMSDGEPNEGKEGENLIAYADKIKNDGIIVYTLGFFESLDNSKSSAQSLLERIASDGCHYEVASADDLVFFFEDMADQINGQKYIYIRIACPVDVTVTHNGEALCSAEDKVNLRTDFGTLTFEENESIDDKDEDDLIKVLRLKEGMDYDVQIVGTGHGMMDYTIGFMDKDGNYSDFRRFENVKITRRTTIDTVAAVSKESVLNIDENGDGKYDLKLRAEKNGYGKKVEKSVLLYVILGSVVVLFLLFLIFIVQKRVKKTKEYM